MPGDVVLLASDGVATLTHEKIGSICAHHAAEGAVRIAEAVIEQIGQRNREGQDNATAIAVRQREDEDDTTSVIRDNKDAAGPRTGAVREGEIDSDATAVASHSEGGARSRIRANSALQRTGEALRGKRNP